MNPIFLDVNGSRNPSIEILAAGGSSVHNGEVTGDLGHRKGSQEIVWIFFVDGTDRLLAHHPIGFRFDNMLNQYRAGAYPSIHRKVENRIGNLLVLDVITLDPVPETGPVKCLYFLLQFFMLVEVEGKSTLFPQLVDDRPPTPLAKDGTRDAAVGFSARIIGVVGVGAFVEEGFAECC